MTVLRSLLDFSQPSTVLTALSVAGASVVLIAGSHHALKRAGWTILVLGLGGLGAMCLLPIDVWVLRPLENRFPATAVTHVDGIVVLGGGITVSVAADRGIPTLNRDGDRLAAFATLARAWPDARLIFAGGPAAHPTGRPSEAALSGVLLDQLGVAPGRIHYDERSLTTWGNALNAKTLAHPNPGETWLLVTSASHMPRAMGAFRAAGWPPLVAWPVAYRTTRKGSPSASRPLGNKLAAVDLAAHEWIGLLYYWLEGRSARLFPGPESSF